MCIVLFLHLEITIVHSVIMSRQNKSSAIDLENNAIAEIAEALFLIYNHAQQKIKSITFQDNNGILNFGSNNRIQIQLPAISTLKFVSCIESEEEKEVIVTFNIYEINFI